MNLFDRLQNILVMWKREFSARVVCTYTDKRGWFNAKVLLPDGAEILLSASDERGIIILGAQ